MMTDSMRKACEYVNDEECFWRLKDGSARAVEEGEDLEKGERLAHRDGRRRLAGRAGLEKFFCFNAEDTEDTWFFCWETNELPFRIIAPFSILRNPVTQIHYIFSRVPSVVFLTLGKTTGLVQTGTVRERQHRPVETTDVSKDTCDFGEEKKQHICHFASTCSTS